MGASGMVFSTSRTVPMPSGAGTETMMGQHRLLTKSGSDQQAMVLLVATRFAQQAWVCQSRLSSLFLVSFLFSLRFFFSASRVVESSGIRSCQRFVYFYFDSRL